MPARCCDDDDDDLDDDDDDSKIYYVGTDDNEDEDVVRAKTQFMSLRPVDACNACDMGSYLYLWILNFLYLGLWSTVRVSITVNANAKLKKKLQKRRGQDSWKRSTCFWPKVRPKKWKKQISSF